jgi:BMFP domain-containing protein YqiC
MMDASIRQLLEVSRKVLAKTRHKIDEGATAKLEAAIHELESNPDAVVQLYSVSQAGKSTLFSMLTGGEQLVPVGLGKATTAVVIELISVETPQEERAEVMWLSPAELLSLVVEPLEPFLDEGGDPRGDEHGAPPSPLTGAARLFRRFEGGAIDVASLEPEALDDPRVRNTFHAALRRAREFRRAEAGEAGSSNDLSVAEVILRRYGAYRQEYRPGYLRLKEYGDLHRWTRQPYDWGNRAPSDFDFDEVRCFFVKRVRLRARTSAFARGIRVIDAPGFGVSRLHDRISRKEQESADAVILLLGASGSEVSNAQLQEVQQLAIGARDNLFVLWNPKSGTRPQAESLLQTDLARLRDGAGVSVPAEHAIVANLLLGLRSLQWRLLMGEESTLSSGTVAALSEAARFKFREKKLPEGDRDRAAYLIRQELRSSFTVYVGDPEDELDGDNSPAAIASAGLEASGWETDIPRLFSTLRGVRANRRAQECAARTADAVNFYLAQFPPPTAFSDLKQKINRLESVVRRFPGQVKETSREIEEAVEENLESLIEELPEYLLDRQSLENLSSGVRYVVDEETQSSVVHTRLRARVKDYLETRCGLWCDDISQFRTTVSGTALRIRYEAAMRDIREWVVAEVGGGDDIPQAALPRIEMDGFRREFSGAFGTFVDFLLTPDYVTRFVSWVAETGKAVAETVSRWWSAAKAWVASRPADEPPARPRFDRAKARAQIERDLAQLFERKTLQYMLAVDPNAYRKLTFTEFLGAMGTAAARGSRSFGDAVNEAFGIVKARREEEIATGHGVIVHAASAIFNAAQASLGDWSRSVLRTVSALRDNLIAEEKGLPSPLPRPELEELAAWVSVLQSSVERGADVSPRLAQASASIDARLAPATPPEGEEAVAVVPAP